MLDQVPPAGPWRRSIRREMWSVVTESPKSATPRALERLDFARLRAKSIKKGGSGYTCYAGSSCKIPSWLQAFHFSFEVILGIAVWNMAGNTQASIVFALPRHSADVFKKTSLPSYLCRAVR